MPLFLDSSALVKLYVDELGSGWMLTVRRSVDVWGGMYVAELSVAEVASALQKKVREKLLKPRPVYEAYEAFEADCQRVFYLVELAPGLSSEAAQIAFRHGRRFRVTGADALQLAAAARVGVLVQPDPLTVVTSDKRMEHVCGLMGLNSWNPERDDPEDLMRYQFRRRR